MFVCLVDKKFDGWVDVEAPTRTVNAMRAGYADESDLQVVVLVNHRLN